MKDGCSENNEATEPQKENNKDETEIDQVAAIKTDLLNSIIPDNNNTNYFENSFNEFNENNQIKDGEGNITIADLNNINNGIRDNRDENDITACNNNDNINSTLDKIESKTDELLNTNNPASALEEIKDNEVINPINNNQNSMIIIFTPESLSTNLDNRNNKPIIPVESTPTTLPGLTFTSPLKPISPSPLKPNFKPDSFLD